MLKFCLLCGTILTMGASMVVFLNTYGPILIYLLVLPYLWFKERSREEVIHIVFSAGVTVLLVLALKEYFNVPRPYLINGGKSLAGHFTDGSFPSLHTAIAFSIAATVTAHQRRFGTFLLFVAGMVGIGRVLANVHTPLDIIGGAFIGTIVALFFDRLHFKDVRKVWPIRKK